MLASIPQLALWSITIAIVTGYVAGFWRVFEKAGFHGWESLIPIYNLYLLCRVAGIPGYNFVLVLVPGLNLLFAISICFRIAGAFDRGGLFGWGLLFFGFIFWPILGFDASTRRHVDRLA